MTDIHGTINKNSPVPIYYQLKEYLREVIRSLEVGSPIPTESDICERFEISRPTVRQAVSALVAEGYLERRKGRGTFVCEPKIRRDFLLVMESFNREMIESGYNPSTRLVFLRAEFADEEICEKLMVRHLEKVYYLRRLRSIQDKPLFVVDSFIPVAKAPGLENHDLEARSLHGLLQNEYGYEFDRAIRSIEIKLAEPAEARELDIEVGNPVHYVETVLYLADGVPLKYARTWYRGDRSKFTYELSRKDISQNRAHGIPARKILGEDGA